MIPVLMLLLPLAAAVVAGLAAARRGLVLASAAIGTLATFALALFLPGSAGVSVPWVPGVGITFSLDATGAASVLVLVAALVMIPTTLYAARRVERSPGAFVAMLLLMQAGLNGIFLAKDLVAFYVFWEATLIPSLLLLGGFGRERRRAAVVKYLIYAVAGSFLMLISILAIKPLSGAASYRLEDLLAAAPGLPVRTQTWLFVGLAIGMAVKLPMWPLHSWLVDFNEQNHPSGAADVAGTLYKVGGFGFFAWALPMLPAGAARVAPVLLVLAAITALYGALAAAAQKDLKRLLAYASLSHMGIVGVGLFGLELAGLNGAVFLLAAQMLSTGGLFLISGMLYDRRGSFDLDRFGGLARSAPALSALTLFILFTAIGVPGLANFPGEFLSLLGAYQGYPWLAAFATLSVIAAGVYGVNLFQRLYQGAEKERTVELRSFEVITLVPLIAGIVWLGLAPAPQMQRIEAQARLVVVQHEAAAAPGGGAIATALPEPNDPAAADGPRTAPHPQLASGPLEAAVGGDR